MGRNDRTFFIVTLTIHKSVCLLPCFQLLSGGRNVQFATLDLLDFATECLPALNIGAGHDHAF